MNNFTNRIGHYVSMRKRAITFIGGSCLVTLWTVIRHLSNGVNFDVVGQIGVTDQWAHGLHDGAQLGATNYLLKMPLYFVVNHFGFLSSHLKLLLLALLFNVATFILLVILFEKILRLYKIAPGTWFYLGMIWLASISGRVYWLDYANSRNLETVGGIWVLYLGLKLLRQVTWRRFGALAVIAGVVFFADQLQLYTIGGGLILFALLRLLIIRSKSGARQSVAVIGGLTIGYLCSKLLLVLATTLLPVTFLTAPKGSESVSLPMLGKMVHGLANSSARIFDASFYDAASVPNAVREGLNLLILFVLMLCIIWCIWKSRVYRQLSAAVICCIAMSYISYVASNQVLQPMTERYLIMVPLLLVLLLGGIGQELSGTLKDHRWGISLIAGGLVLCSFLTVGALIVSWPNRYSKDAYITDVLIFMQANKFGYAVSSRDGIPETYFANGTATVIPTICQPDHRLIVSNLFYDKATFTRVGMQSVVPIIIPTGGIVSSGSVCDLPYIEKQLGQPIKTMSLPGIGTAMIYTGEQLKSIE